MRPDYLVKPAEGSEFIAEVLTIFQSREDERGEANLYRLASALDQIAHRIGVFIDHAWMPPRTPNLRPVVASVRRWLDSCDGTREQRFTTRRPVSLKLSTVVPPRDEPAPIVVGMLGAGGEINADETMWTMMTRKINNYRAVKDLRLPFVLFLWEGDWLKVSERSLQWALFRRDEMRIFRQAGRIIGHQWGRAPDGLFAFGHDGRGNPRNTRLSAVAYCARDVMEARVHVRMRLNHHPYAANPLPTSLFDGAVSQCLPEQATADEATCRWDHTPGEVAPLLLR